MHVNYHLTECHSLIQFICTLWHGTSKYIKITLSSQCQEECYMHSIYLETSVQINCPWRRPRQYDSVVLNCFLQGPNRSWERTGHFHDGNTPTKLVTFVKSCLYDKRIAGTKIEVVEGVGSFLADSVCLDLCCKSRHRIFERLLNRIVLKNIRKVCTFKFSGSRLWAHPQIYQVRTSL